MIRIPHPVLVVSLLSSIFTPHYTSPIIIIHHHHPSSSIIILHHPSSSIIILHHPSFIMIMYRWEPQNCKFLISRRSFWRRSGFISRSTWGHPGVFPQPGPLCEGEWVGVKIKFEKYSFPTRSFQGGWVGWNINSGEILGVFAWGGVEILPFTLLCSRTEHQASYSTRACRTMLRPDPHSTPRGLRTPSQEPLNKLLRLLTTQLIARTALH